MSVGFKNSVVPLRNAIRTVTAIEVNPKYVDFKDELVEYKKKLAK